MSFRSAKTEASLRLYSLPRRELQALCKQYGIPANKTNVKMADALSTCVTADNTRTKGFAGSSSLGVSKTTLMKLKVERKTELPETSLASFILNGKGKASPAKPTVVAFEEDPSFPKPNTTPLKRGIKRTERPLPTVHEERAVSAAPSITRGSAASHDGKSVPSPKPRAPTPRKRTAEIAAVVTRRGGDALPPVSFSDLLSTPKKSEPQVHNTTQLTSTGKTAKKMKTRLGGSRASPQDDEAKAPTLPHVSRGKRVAFADEVKFENTRTREPIDSNSASDQGNQLEPETETIEISYAEIEFKDTPLHRELLGVRRKSPVDEEQDVASAPRETEQAKDASESSVQPSFEFRDMALHKELFGSTRETNNHVETSAHASDSEAAVLGISNSPFTSPPDAFVYSNSPVEHNLTVLSILSSIREDPSEQTDSKMEGFDAHIEDHLPQGRDLSPLLNDIACDDLAESRCEKGLEAVVCTDKDSPGCSLKDSQNNSVPTSVQEPPAKMSPGADVPLVIQEADMQQDQQLLDSHTINTVVDNVLKTEVTHVSSSPVLHESQKVHTCRTPKTAEAQRFPQTLGEADKGETHASPSAEAVISSGSKPVMPDAGTFEILVTPLTKNQSIPESPLEKSGTPLTRIQTNIDSTLARATSILEKLAAWRADAERKVREGYWEPKFSSVMENASPAAAVFKMLVAKPAAMLDMDLPSAMKARPAPKTASALKKGLVVCEDTDIVSNDKVSSDSVTTTRISDESRDSSEVSDKENLVEKSMGDKASRALGVLGKEKRKGKKFEVLKDRSKNLLDHASGDDAYGTIKADNNQVRPEGMSLRKLRAQVKEKVRQMETSKVSDVLTQRSWN